MEEIKSKILNTALEMFFRYGIRSVSMDDIARELSMSKKTIYQYYKDKDEIVTEGVRNHFWEEEKEFAEILVASEDALDEMMRLTKCMRKNMEGVNTSVTYDLQKYYPKAWSLVQEFKDGFIRSSVINVIERGKKEGLFRPEINDEILTIYRIESIQLTFDPKIFPADKFDFVEVQITLLDHFIRGLLTLDGLKKYEELINSRTDEDK